MEAMTSDNDDLTKLAEIVWQGPYLLEMKFSVSIAISLTSTERPEQDSVGKFLNTVEELDKTPLNPFSTFQSAVAASDMRTALCAQDVAGSRLPCTPGCAARRRKAVRHYHVNDNTETSGQSPSLQDRLIFLCLRSYISYAVDDSYGKR